MKYVKLVRDLIARALSGLSRLRERERLRKRGDVLGRKLSPDELSKMLKAIKAMQAKGMRMMCDLCGALFVAETLTTICPDCSWEIERPLGRPPRGLDAETDREPPYQREERLLQEMRVDNGEYDCENCRTARDFDGDNACQKHIATRKELS